MITEPQIEHRQEQLYAAIRTAVPIPFGSLLPPLWKEVNEWLKKKGIVFTGPALIRYLTTDMSKKLDVDVGYALEQPLTGDGRVIVDSLPEGEYATLLYIGPYKGKGVYKANVSLIDWAKENHVVWNTAVRDHSEWWNGRVEYYLSDPDREEDPKKYRAELAFLVK